MARDDPYTSDPYFFVIGLGYGPKDFRSRRGGLSSNSEAASPLQHKMQNEHVRQKQSANHVAKRETLIVFIIFIFRHRI